MHVQDICRRTDDDCSNSDRNDDEEIALTAITIVGVVLSMIGLVLTVFTLLVFKYVVWDLEMYSNSEMSMFSLQNISQLLITN